LSNLKFVITFLLTTALLAAIAIPVLALDYNPGVTTGQYVKYGNFAGIGPGVEVFNDYDWLKLEVTGVSGKSVTLLSTSQYKNGTAIPGNGLISVWNVEAGTEDGLPSTQGPIIAANFNQGDTIPPPNTYAINRTENRVYLGVSRTVVILDVSLVTPDYSSTLTYVYDRASGFLLESTTQTITQAQPQPVTTEISYNVVETTIFDSTSNPSPTIPEFLTWTVGVILLIILIIAVAILVLSRKRKQV
jgi:hypothetical protein